MAAWLAYHLLLWRLRRKERAVWREARRAADSAYYRALAEKILIGAWHQIWWLYAEFNREMEAARNGETEK